MAGADRSIRDWAEPRVRVLGTALLSGVVVGAVAAVGYGFVVDPRRARTVVFALGALLLGFGTIGWSGSVMAGRGIENMQRYLETGSDWTERDSRRAMTRIAGFGGGVMVGAPLL